MLKLRPYQVEAALELYTKKRAIVPDGMGLGKCAEAIAAKNLIEKREGCDARTLIVCPSSTIPHWIDEIKLWYHKKGETSIAPINTTNYHENVAHAKYSDFTIVGYPTISYLGQDRQSIGKLEEIGFRYGIVDEVHNAKNPESIRSCAVKGLFDSMDYLALLSGTIIPNSIVDIYMLLSLVDKENFKVPLENKSAVLSAFYNMFKEDPGKVKTIVEEHLINGHVRDADTYLHASVPKLNLKNVEIPLTGEHRETYMQIYQNDNIKHGNKLIQLIKASIDPGIVNPKLLDADLASRIKNAESNVFKKLDDIVKEAVDRNGKVLIFSDLKVGITNNLKERYKEYGALVIDGETSADIENGKATSEREKIREQFQRNPNSKVLLSTTVMDEGVDLTGATDVVHLTLPYTPAVFDQRNSRSQRIGEVKKENLNVHVLIPKLPNLVPTVTEGIYELLNDKRKIIEFIIKDPLRLTKQDLQELENGHSEKSRPLANVISNPGWLVKKHIQSLKAAGVSKIRDMYQSDPKTAESFARLYASSWEGSFGGNTANLYSQVIKLLEQKANLKDKLDVASGPFSLSRAIKEPVTNLDINQYMLEAGKMLEKEGIIVPGNNGFEGSMTEMPFDKGSFDFTLCSLAMHMLKRDAKYGKDKENERELAFREMNRVLRDKGQAMITLPSALLTEEDLVSFNKDIEQLGFKVLPYTGFYKGPAGSNYSGCFLAGLKKIGNPGENSLGEKAFEWHMDREFLRKRTGTSRARKLQIKTKEPPKREIVTKFFKIGSNKSLAEIVLSS